MHNNTTTPLNNAVGIFGEVLFDEFPDGQQVLGGAPFNVAWHLQAFGVAPLLLSRVGSDARGTAIKQAMQHWGLSCEGLQTDTQRPTGTVKISLQAGEPSYAILADQAYDAIEVAARDEQFNFSVLYHGTLALRSEQTRTAFQHVVARHAGKVFLDVNLRQPWWTLALLQQCLARADWVKLNQDELQQIPLAPGDINARMLQLQSDFSLETVIVTLGAQGALALTPQQTFIYVAPSAELSVVDTVGAGDAFSAVLLLGLHLDWPLELSLERAQTFASALVTQRGATVHDVSFYQQFKCDWLLTT